MSDYFDELGCEPTGPNGPNDFAKHYKKLQVLAVMHGIDMEVEVPEASKRAISKLPVFVYKKDTDADDEDDDEDDENECSVCKSQPVDGDVYKILPCKHKFHEECILLWLKKSNSCPLCRYELETDDPDYEELRKFRAAEPQRRERLNDLMGSMFS